MAGRHAANLDADYEAAGFGNRLGFGSAPALLVVDMVMAYFDPTAPLYAAVEDELAATKRLIEAARAAGVPVFWTRVEFTPGGADGGHFFNKIGALAALERGSPLCDFAPGLSPASSEVVITKQYPSAFFGTTLASTLTAAGIDTCLIAGLTTSGCVRATALDTIQNGFIPVVIPEACGDRDERVQMANLFDLGQKYADIVPEAEIIAFLDTRHRQIAG